MATIKACDWCGRSEQDGFITAVNGLHADLNPLVNDVPYYPKAYDLCLTCKTLLEALIQESQALGRKEGWLPPREDPGKAKPGGWSLGWGRKG